MEVLRDLPEAGIPPRNPHQVDLIMTQVVGLPRSVVERIFVKNNEEIVPTIVELGLRSERRRRTSEEGVRRQLQHLNLRK